MARSREINTNNILEILSELRLLPTSSVTGAFKLVLWFFCRENSINMEKNFDVFQIKTFLISFQFHILSWSFICDRQCHTAA
jgi:hypothetical protein